MMTESGDKFKPGSQDMFSCKKENFLSEKLMKFYGGNFGEMGINVCNFEYFPGVKMRREGTANVEIVQEKDVFGDSFIYLQETVPETVRLPPDELEEPSLLLFVAEFFTAERFPTFPPFG